jgi:hypothetical protein
MLAPMPCSAMRSSCTASLVGLLLLASCGDGPAPADASAADAPAEGMDAPSADAPASLDAPAARDDASPLDATPTEDAPPAFDALGADAASSEDATSSPDARGLDAGCPRSEPTRMAGICDGRGRAICQMWSDSLGGGRMTTAVCLGTGGFCARADTCTSVDPDSCTCGAGPRCADDQVCVFSADRAPRCECITP